MIDEVLGLDKSGVLRCFHLELQEVTLFALKSTISWLASDTISLQSAEVKILVSWSSVGNGDVIFIALLFLFLLVLLYNSFKDRLDCLYSILPFLWEIIGPRHAGLITELFHQV